MSSTGTRVVPTLTEVLDEQRLSKPHTNLSTEPWRDSRPGDEELVPISLDWGDEPAGDAAGPPAPGADEVMTPWQVVQPREAHEAHEASDDAPFIDLSIEVAPVRPPALHEQVLDVYPSPVDGAAQGLPTDAADGPAPDLDASQALAAEARREELASPPPPLDEPVAEPALGTLAFMDEVPAFLRAVPAPALPTEPAPAVADEPASGAALSAATPAPAAPGDEALAPVPDASSSMLDPGRLAVRQGSVQGLGISEERLQAILQEALDRLLRDELPSALVETLIRLSPQLSESLIESLKPSLHLHVMEALSAEVPASLESRRQG